MPQKNSKSNAQSHQEIFNLSLKFLKEELTKKEEDELNLILERRLKEGDQALFDFLSQEFSKAGPDLGEVWKNFVSDFCITDISSVPDIEAEKETKLFIIPVVMATHTESVNRDDFFEIASPDKIQELAFETGLLLEGSETLTFIPQLLSFDDLGTLNETKKYRFLRSLMGDQGFSLLENDFFPPVRLTANLAEIKCKFILGCVELLKDSSPLANLFGLNPSVSDEEIHSDVEIFADFSNQLSEMLPDVLAKKDLVECETNYAGTIQELTPSGIWRAIRDYDQFKLGLLLSRSEHVKSPKIKIKQTVNEFIDLDLFEGRELVQGIKIVSQYETSDDMLEGLDELFEEMESFGFTLESNSDEELIFSKKGSKPQPTLSPALH